MTDLTREEVRANRIKWCDWLETPGRRKAVGYLSIVGGGACCLGHGCNALGIKRTKRKFAEKSVWAYGERQHGKFAPEELTEAVGLHNDHGSAPDYLAMQEKLGRQSLSEVNDNTDTTPAQIGAYLRTVIEGGEHTPFRPPSDYPEGSS